MDGKAMRYREQTVEDRKPEVSKSRSDSSTQQSANPRNPGPSPPLSPSTLKCCEWCGSLSVPRSFCASCGLPKLYGSKLYHKMIAASAMSDWSRWNVGQTISSGFEATRMRERVQLMSPHAVGTLLDREYGRTMVLVLDLRPHELFISRWITGSINLHLQTDPGQLWEQTTGPLAKTVVGEADRETIREWRSYPFIVVYDAHSSGYGETKWPFLILDRFIEAGWPGIGWVVNGGFDALAVVAPLLVKRGPLTFQPSQKHLERHNSTTHKRMSGLFQQLSSQVKSKEGRVEEEEVTYSPLNKASYVIFNPRQFCVGDIFKIWKQTDEILHLSTVVLVYRGAQNPIVCKIHRHSGIKPNQQFRRYNAQVREYRLAEGQQQKGTQARIPKAGGRSQDLPPVDVVIEHGQYMEYDCWLDLRGSFDIDPLKGYNVARCGELTAESRLLVLQKWRQFHRDMRFGDSQSMEDNSEDQEDSERQDLDLRSNHQPSTQETDKPDRIMRESKDWSMTSRSKSPSRPDPEDFLPRRFSKGLFPTYTSAVAVTEQDSITPDWTETKQHQNYESRTSSFSSEVSNQLPDHASSHSQLQQYGSPRVRNVFKNIVEAQAEGAAALEIEDEAFDDRWPPIPEPVDALAPTRSVFVPAAVEIRQISEILMRALQDIGVAKIRGHAYERRRAIEAYTAACESLQQLISRSADVEEQERLQDLMSSHEERIVELQRLEESAVLAVGGTSQDPAPDGELGQIRRDSLESPKRPRLSSTGETADANSELSNPLERSTSEADSEDSAGLGFVKVSKQINDGTPGEAKRHADGVPPSTGPMSTIRTAATPEDEEGPPGQVKGHVEESGAVRAAGWHLPIAVLKSTAMTAAITEDDDEMLPQARKGAPVHSSPPKDKDSERERQREESYPANGRKFHTGFRKQNKAKNFVRGDESRANTIFMVLTIIFVQVSFVWSLFRMNAFQIEAPDLADLDDRDFWASLFALVATLAACAAPARISKPTTAQISKASLISTVIIIVFFPLWRISQIESSLAINSGSSLLKFHGTIGSKPRSEWWQWLQWWARQAIGIVLVLIIAPVCFAHMGTTENSGGNDAGSNGKAIYIFTIVTMISLPLNFVASVFGMSINGEHLNIRDESTVWLAVTMTASVAAGSVLLYAFREPLLEWLRTKTPGLEHSTLFRTGRGTRSPEARGAHLSSLSSLELNEFNLRHKLKSMFKPSSRELLVRGARIADAFEGTADDTHPDVEDKQLVPRESIVSPEASAWIVGAIYGTWFGVWATHVLATCLSSEVETCQQPSQLYHHASMLIAGTCWGLVASVSAQAIGVTTAVLSSWVAHWYAGELCGPKTSIDIANLLCLVTTPIILRHWTLRMLHDDFVISWQTKITGICVSVGVGLALLLVSNCIGGEFDKQIRAWVLSCAILGTAVGAGSLVSRTIWPEEVADKLLELQPGTHWTSKVKTFAWTSPGQYFRRLKQLSNVLITSYGAWFSRMLEPRLRSGHCRIRIKCACGVHIWDDYPTKWRSEALKLQEKLNRHFRRVENSSAPQQKADGVRSVIGRLASDWKLFSNALRRCLLRESSDARVDDESRQPENTPPENQSLPHYLTCYPQAGDRRPRLVQVQSVEIQGDNDYFSMLRQHTRSMRRSWTRFLAPRKIKAVQYVQVHLLHDNEHVDVLQSLEPQFPKNNEEYSPVDSQLRQSDALYFGPNTLLHFFEKEHDCCQHPHVLSAIPKKLKGKLSVPPKGRPMVGWGMQLVDGIDTFRLGLSGFAGLLVSSVAGIIWARVQQDVQGGSGIAQVLMYFVTFIVTMHGVSEVR